MRSRIEKTDLLEAVRGFLKSAEGELSGRMAFHAKVAGNALAIVERELEHVPSATSADALAALLPDIAAEAREAEVCRRIRAGDWNVETPGLLNALAAGAAARLGVDNPRFSTLKRLKEKLDEY